MGEQRARSPKGQSLTNAGRRPGYAEDRGGLGEFIELGADPCAWLPGAREDGRLQTGGLGKAGAGGRSWTETRGDQEAKNPVGTPRAEAVAGASPGGRGGLRTTGPGTGAGGAVCPSARGGADALCTQAGEPPGARPAAAPRGGVGRARPRRPLPRGPAAVTRPPLGRPALPAPSRRRPPPEPSPGNASSPTASSWRGRGPRRRPGEEGTGGGGAESEAGPGASGGAGGSRRRWRKELRGGGSPGGGKAAAAAAAAPRARPSPSGLHPTWRPFPGLLPCDPRGGALLPPGTPTPHLPPGPWAHGETEAQKGVQRPLRELGPASHWQPDAASTPPPLGSRGAALEGQPHLDLLTPQTCAHYTVPGSTKLVAAPNAPQGHSAGWGRLGHTLGKGPGGWGLRAERNRDYENPQAPRESQRGP